jgi:hypothetical protein
MEIASARLASLSEFVGPDYSYRPDAADGSSRVRTLFSILIYKRRYISVTVFDTQFFAT